MTAICKDCGRNTGERCPVPDCQSTNVHLIPCAASTAMFRCGDCDAVFLEGTGGTAKSLCDECAQSRRLKAALDEYMKPRGRQ